MNSGRRTLLRGVPPALAGIVGVGGLARLAWGALGLPAAGTIDASLRSMHPNAAVGLVLAAVALFLVGGDAPRRRWALLPALAVVLLGIASWAEAVSPADLGVSGLFVGGRPPPMPTGTAVNLTLLGVGLAAAVGSGRRAREGAVVLALLVAAAALEGVLGWLWGVLAGEGSPWVRTVAVHALLAFVALAVGLLCTRAEDGPLAVVLERSGARFVTRLLPFAFVLRLLVGWATAGGNGRGHHVGVQFGLTMFALANLLMVAGVVAWSTRALTAAERERKQVAADLEATRERERDRGALAAALRRAAEAQEGERRRIAQELHDGIGSSLAQVLFELDTWARRLPEGPERDGLEALRGRLADVVADVGRTARGLHPSVLEDLGLEAAVGQLGRGRAGADAAEVHVAVAGLAPGERLAPAVELAAYRIVQEAVANADRHARARDVSVLVRREADHLVVVVEDDGRGFDVDAAGADPSGLGLRDMRDRVRGLGGTLTVESTPDRGTTVRATLLLAPTAHA